MRIGVKLRFCGGGHKVASESHAGIFWSFRRASADRESGGERPTAAMHSYAERDILPRLLWSSVEAGSHQEDVLKLLEAISRRNRLPITAPTLILYFFQRPLLTYQTNYYRLLRANTLLFDQVAIFI